jgi:hypothetical protein
MSAITRSVSALSLHTMWFPLHPIASLAAGLLGNLQQPLNISLGNTTGLTASQFSAFTPYIEFARAAYCDANKIAGWKCGGEPFPLRACVSQAYREGKRGLQCSFRFPADFDRRTTRRYSVL